jgi:hypothetical protein
MGKLLILAVVTVATMIAIAAAAIALNNQQTDNNNSPSPTPNPTVSTSTGPTPAASPKTNESATATFEVPIQIFETQHTFQSDNNTFYTAIAYIAWEPSTYVRYYEVTPNYHGNTKPYENLFLGSDFRTWSSRQDELHPLGWSEKDTWILATRQHHRRGNDKHSTFYC